MSILDSIAENLPESVLDAVFQLQQKRLQQIETEGTAVTLTSRSDYPTLKTIKAGDQWFFSPSAPIKAGATLRDGSLVNGTFVILSIEEQAGRLACSVQHLPDVCSFYQARSISNDYGLDRRSLTPTNWCGIACRRDGSTLTLPATYAPDRGDVLLIDGQHFTAAKTRPAGPTIEVELEPY